VGKHRIDYLVENEVIVELKAVEVMNKIYEAQLLTYLRAMNMHSERIPRCLQRG